MKEKSFIITLVVVVLITFSDNFIFSLSATSNVYFDAFLPLDLNEYFNNDGIASETNRADGDFDAIGSYQAGNFNYAAEELPPSNSIVTISNIPFRFPDKTDGKKNNILLSGQKISFPPNNYSGIYFLGASVNGDYEAPLVLYYTGGDKEEKKLGLSDWCRNPQYGESLGILCSYRIMKNGPKEPRPNAIWLQAIYPDSKRKLESIQLPVHQCMHVFAITLSTAKPPKLEPASRLPSCLSETETSALNIEIKIKNIGNIFFAEESEKLISVKVSNIPSDIKELLFTYKLTDIENNVIQQKTERLTRWANGAFLYKVIVPVDVKGFYKIIVSLTEVGSEKILSENTSSFAILEKIEESKNKFEQLSPFGMCFHFHSLDLEEKKKAASLLQLAGIKWTREGFDWGLIEPQKGNFTWTAHDSAVEIASAYNILQYGLLGYWAGWTKPYTAEGYSDFSDYVYELVNRYKGRINHWEVWNEPNIWYWKGTPEQYVELLKVAYRAAKKANPNCYIIGGVTAGIDTVFLERIFKKGALEYMDILSIHPYRGEYLDQSNFPEQIENLNRMINKYTKGKKKIKIWITELGWWTSETGEPGSVTPIEQANKLIRSYITSLACGVEKIFWYCFKDSSWINKYSEHNFGIIRPDYTPKPAYVALANLTRLLHQARFLDKLELTKGLVCYRFVKSDNKKIASLWITDKWSNNKIFSLYSDATSITIIDAWGNKQDISPLEGKFSLPISETPIFILGNFKEIKLFKN